MMENCIFCRLIGEIRYPRLLPRKRAGKLWGTLNTPPHRSSACHTVTISRSRIPQPTSGGIVRMFRTEAALLTFVTALTIVPATAVSAAEGHRKVRLNPVLAIAHRGASAYAPENTLAAFRLAGQQGADLGRTRRPADQGPQTGRDRRRAQPDTDERRRSSPSSSRGRVRPTTLRDQTVWYAGILVRAGLPERADPHPRRGADHGRARGHGPDARRRGRTSIRG